MYPSKTAPERLADGLVHAVSLAGFAIAAGFLIQKSSATDDIWLTSAAIIYVAAGLFSIMVSFAYHLHPRHEWRPALRRWDHAAIYVVIAGTFSPLLIIAGSTMAHAVLAVIWLAAMAGVAFKLMADNGDSRWSLISYLALGWTALIALPSFWNALPAYSTAAIAAGGLFYTVGTLFYRNKIMRFRYPIWHAFGTLGGTSFFAAIWMAVAGVV
ncbi:putative hemolysin III [Erythrobacter sp. NAP1]|uniref:PAQR family membrane homeostasis protein TrhA n=1 Tax=Erythrobacter sp. NAP1 TaxID=237727 RepID=UPI0000686B1A|nr:hemolysin III family protein [Erythrobacter sp. NAP1]EAQ30490.1 putative hemolysin III [Erythrobacter sp. NAP1]